MEVATILIYQSLPIFLIKGIIFDVGFTLMSFSGDWSEVVRNGAEEMSDWFLKKKRIKHDQAALIEAFITERKAAQVLAYQTNQEVTAEACLREALQKIEASPRALTLLPDAIKIYFRVEETKWRRYPEAIDTLKQLHAQGYRLGCYANAPDDPFLQRIINQTKLRPWLSPTFSSAVWGWRKPKPEPFLLIAERWGLDPAEIAVVGDTLRTDILGAHQAGMVGVLATMQEAPSNDDHRDIIPQATIPSLSTLPGILRRLKP